MSTVSTDQNVFSDLWEPFIPSQHQAAVHRHSGGAPGSILTKLKRLLGISNQRKAKGDSKPSPWPKWPYGACCKVDTRFPGTSVKGLHSSVDAQSTVGRRLALSLKYR